MTTKECNELREFGLDTIKSWQNKTDAKQKNYEALLIVIEVGDYDSVKYLLEIGTCPIDVTVLRAASIAGKVSIFELLISYGVDIHSYHDNALQVASYYGRLEVVKFLVENGADIHTNDDFAVRYACEQNHLEVVKYLVSVGANIRAHKDWALVVVCGFGFYELFELIISLGTDIHTFQDYALANACAGNHTKIVKRLVELGANLQTGCGDVFYIASAQGNVESQKFLISHGSDFRMKDDFALARAVASCQWEFVSYLLSLGVPEYLVSDERYFRYLVFVEKMREKARVRAQKKIYFWIIPKLYDLNNESGLRLRQKNYEKYLELCSQ